MSHRHFDDDEHAEVYAKFRSDIVPSVLQRILDFMKTKATGPWKDAADVGCGSGQSTPYLAPHFKKVTGLDVSEAQIKEAQNKNTLGNVHYGVSPAETLPFDDNSLQLIMSCQACHWFDLPLFFKEVDRCLAPGGVVALCGYDFPRPILPGKSQQLLEVIVNIYSNDLGPFWSPKLKYLDDHYKDIVIPYPDFQRVDNINHPRQFTVQSLVSYIKTWSGYQAYKNHFGEDSALKLEDNFQKRLLNVLETTSRPEDVSLDMEYPVFLLLASKPSQKS